MHGSTPSTNAAKDSHGVLQESKSPRAFFALFALVILAAFVSPAFGLLNGILLIGLLTFSAFGLFVAVVVRKPGDIFNFPLIAAVILFLRLGLGVNISKAILLKQETNGLISAVGPVFGSWYSASAWCGIAIMLGIAGLRLSETITRSAEARLAQSADDQPLARFYRASITMSKMLGADTAAWLVVTLAAGFAAATLAIMDPSEKFGLGLVMANSALTAMPLAMLLVSFAILMKKDFVFPAHADSSDDDHESKQAIPVESSVIDQREIEDFDHEIEPGRDFDLSNSHLAQEHDFEPAIAVPDEKSSIARFFAVNDYYEPIAAEIFACGKSITLFAGQSKDFLPVTVPVNVAINLAQMKKRCLVIDNDFSRNAIAAVFDLDCQANAGKAVLTEHDFWVSPADEKVPLAKKIKNAARAFDHVLVYSPSPFVQDLSSLKTDGPEAMKITITMGPVGPLSALLDTLEDVGFKIIYDADLIKEAI
ncbi:MAG: hypothetical protein A2Y07_02530 [Planctomycetes bacterium GWF2_50_10]|nr:MAG: hypothetical protein A2Y07_02530 [Planctomycetes bacterium GWF2_50_10]